jgi:hypothetical protein
MTEGTEETAHNTSLYYPAFQYMFEAADMAASFWQPTLKAIGRAQLELAGLQAKQTRAFIHWAYQWSRPTGPNAILNANAQFWSTIAQEYAETAPRVAAAVETAAEAAAMPEVLQMPPKPVRDTLILLDRDEANVSERKVA